MILQPDPARPPRCGPHFTSELLLASALKSNPETDQANRHAWAWVMLVLRIEVCMAEWCPQHKSCLQAVEARTVRVRDTSSDRRILELGWQDVGTIKSVISGKMPTEALRTAEHLNEAYQDFLQLMRVEDEALGKRPRPWENAPESEVCGCLPVKQQLSREQ